MVSGTLNNSNFYIFKSYWIFGILGIFSKFQTSKPYWKFETLVKVSKFQNQGAPVPLNISFQIGYPKVGFWAKSYISLGLDK